MQPGGNLQEVYSRLVSALNGLDSTGIKFALKEGIGYLTFCPSNLGTGMRVSCHMKIPLLAQQPNFEALCKSLGLQARGVDGEHTESKDGVYDISNIQRLGKTELDIIRDLAKAVQELIGKEQKLEQDAERASKAETPEKTEATEKTRD
ncbi:unnamed protein product [Lymnaea stagnalis]|uniref:Phosphagen kinase C-terminal domain-containing protein n=1 Tax=Lymnaea stagnalis TaxID=6523 RepID=A0AAV2I4G8_LYMST